jgi:hypothetical protein
MSQNNTIVPYNKQTLKYDEQTLKNIIDNLRTIRNNLVEILGVNNDNTYNVNRYSLEELSKLKDEFKALTPKILSKIINMRRNLIINKYSTEAVQKNAVSEQAGGNKKKKLIRNKKDETKKNKTKQNKKK